MAALADHVALGLPTEHTRDVAELRRAVQFCSVGLGDLPVNTTGVQTPAAEIVAALDLEDFVERRIRGWARLN
jgi:hypothetical protein